MRGRKPAAERLKRERIRSEYLSQLGSKGGKRSLVTMTPEQRHERAKKAVAAREAKRKKGTA
jgi:hypothetical protein